MVAFRTCFGERKGCERVSVVERIAEGRRVHEMVARTSRDVLKLVEWTLL